MQRGHNFAIVDEVDSILIDEARTPLIISGPAEQAAAVVRRVRPDRAAAAQRDGDYEVDEKKRTVAHPRGAASPRSRTSSASRTSTSAVNTPLVGYLNNAIKAKELYKRDKDYIVMNGEVLIVDEFTGRMLHGRRYNEGMHQAIEAKEGVEIKDENQTLATITLQNYFRLYEKLSGMTGTAMTEAAEFAPDLQARRGADPDQPADGPRRPGRRHLQDRGGQVRGRRRRHRRAARQGPAGAGRHRQRREVRAAVDSCCASGASRTRC